MCCMYFPTDSFISVVTVVEGSFGVQVGVGLEGMLGAQVVPGVATSSRHASEPSAGTAFRMSTVKFKKN